MSQEVIAFKVLLKHQESIPTIFPERQRAGKDPTRRVRLDLMVHLELLKLAAEARPHPFNEVVRGLWAVLLLLPIGRLVVQIPSLCFLLKLYSSR
jgi:hypothetical protein